MPRYKEFNEIRVTEKAMHQFWSHGYGATSLSDLTKVMRINKFSFYEEFESKEGLLIRTMRHYYENYFLPCLEQLREKKSITGFLTHMLQEDENKRCGCYILTITAETGQSIPEAVEILKQYVDQTDSVLREIIRKQHPGIDEAELDLTARQLLAICTSVPMMHSVQPVSECIHYAENMMQLMKINPGARYA